MAANFIIGALAVYIVFNLFWGLNYNRRGIDYQLKLDSLNYTNDDLKQVTMLLAIKMNELQPSSTITRQNFEESDIYF